MFTYSTQPRGSVVHAASLGEALARHGHDVTLFALSKNAGQLYRDVGCDVRLIPAGEAPVELDALIAQRIGELERGLRALCPELDVLHGQDCLATSALLAARERCPSLAVCPLVRTVHHVERFESRYLLECQRRSVLGADVLLSVSRMTRDDVWATFGRRSLQVENGVEPSRFRSLTPVPRAQRRAAAGVADQAFVVLSVGGVEKRKNSVRCLEAFAALAGEASEAIWVIAGGATVLDHRDYQEQFEAALTALPEAIRCRVLRTGIVDERRMTDLYLASDVLLCASEQEGFGLCVLEAMAARLPVIVPEGPPFDEYVPRRAARFVDPRRADDIALALRQLWRQPSLRARLAAEGEHVARAYSWERSAEKHSLIYERAIAERRAGSPMAAPRTGPARPLTE
jgi:glycosyltransferase-like protein